MLVEHGHAVAAHESSGVADVVVVDAPEAGLLDGLPVAASSQPGPAILALSDDPALPERFARSGLPGWGCLGRDVTADELDGAVCAAAAGLAALSRPLAAASVRAARVPGPSCSPPALTTREVQVLQLIAEGYPNKSIARALGITENTAKFHVASVCAKLGVRSRTEAVTAGARNGLVLL
jgi:DNA-binding NarL/FixJ family response regulator